MVNSTIYGLHQQKKINHLSLLFPAALQTLHSGNRLPKTGENFFFKVL